MKPRRQRRIETRRARKQRQRQQRAQFRLLAVDEAPPIDVEQFKRFMDRSYVEQFLDTVYADAGSMMNSLMCGPLPCLWALTDQYRCELSGGPYQMDWQDRANAYSPDPPEENDDACSAP